MSTCQTSWWLPAITLAIGLLASTTVPAQDSPSADGARPAATAAAGDDLSVEQARLADRFERFEVVLSQLAEISAATDPNRARLLRQAIAQSREQDLNLRFESIVKLLEEERLSAAAKNQTDLHQELDALLTLLLKADRDKELESERDRVRQYLKEMARLIRMQKSVRARTEGGDEPRGLADDQQRVADDTGKLGSSIEKKERAAAGTDANPSNEKSTKPAESSKSGEPSEPGQPSPPSDSPPSDSGKSDSGKSLPSPNQPGSPSQGGQSSGDQQSSPPQQPAERATERLRVARAQMDEARKKLEDTQPDEAVERQQQALAELERAKAELERVLRQLREEELERMLTQLVARFRRMLELQNAVYEGTVRLDRVPPVDRDHDTEIQSAGLSRDESHIVHEADKTLVLLREEGSSVAFPEAIDQMRADMLQVTERLSAVKVDRITQGLEEDIVAQLEETIAALEKARKDLEKNRTPPGQSPPAGQQSEPPLVNKLDELKMIRSLQVRINRRTQRYGEMIAAGGQAESPELLEALRELSQRQERVYQATFDLSQGRND